MTFNDEAGRATRSLPLALIALACGHMLSSMLRTIPAVSFDLLTADLHVAPQTLANLTSIYPFAFAAAQIPVGAALDRFGVRPVALSLLLGTVVGAIVSALAGGPVGFGLGQLLLGIATSGLLMCPMTLAAKQLTASAFGVWSGLVLSIGNIGMLVSSSPLAFVIDRYGWRAGFWIAAADGLLVALAVFALVPRQPADLQDQSSPLAQMIAVVRIGKSRRLRGLIAVSFVSFATLIALRGLWGGPWLMDLKGLSRVEAGNVLAVFTVAMIAGPLCIGTIDRWLGRRRGLVAATQALAAITLTLIALGGPGYPVSRLVGVAVMPPAYDLVLLVLFGLASSAQPLLFAIARQLTSAQDAGKALAAVNLSFFLGAALMQSSTGAVASIAGLPAVLLYMAAVVLVCTSIFWFYSRDATSTGDERRATAR